MHQRLTAAMTATLVLLVCLPAASDVIQMKNGTLIKGSVESTTDTSVTVKLPSGASVTLPLNKIAPSSVYRLRLAQLDGKRLETGRGEAVLDTDGLELRRIKRTPLERFLGFLADPNLAFLLLTLGGIGILIEFLNPGVIVPGLFGVIALALAFVAMGNLPVNWVGVGLIALAMVLFFFETQAPGIGIFGISGGISFILGAFLLFGGFGSPSIPTPGFRVSLWLIGTVSAILFGFMVLLLRVVLQSRGAVYSTGAATFVGQTGTTTTELAPYGSVQLASELWSAVSDSGEPIAKGVEIVVLEVEGLTLKVFKAPDTME